VILADTSGLLAALFPDQRHHAACADVVRRSKDPLVLSPFVLAELDYLILKLAGLEAESLLLEEVTRGAYRLAPFDAVDVGRAREIVERYRELAIGLADASIVVLAERFDVREVLTLDRRHFETLRFSGRRHFRILPLVR